MKLWIVTAPTRELLQGAAFVAALLVAAVGMDQVWHRVDADACRLEALPADAFQAYQAQGLIPHTDCYALKLRRDGGLERPLALVAEFEALLAARYPRMGYKVGLHDPDEQSMMRLPGPLFGVLFGDEFWVENGGALVSDYEYVGFEPDLLFRFADSSIMDATTLEEAAAAIDQVCAFIELPAHPFDPALHRGSNLPDFLLVQAVNLSARYGVRGDCLDTRGHPDLVGALDTMTIVSSDHHGEQQTFHDRRDFDDDHVLVTALVAAEHMKRRGERLAAGDYLSVGALSNFGAAASWGMLEFGAPMRHVNYFIGEDMLHVAVSRTEKRN